MRGQIKKERDERVKERERERVARGGRGGILKKRGMRDC